MKGLPVRREQFGERKANAVDAARADMARQLNTIPFLRGRLISVMFTAVTDQVVNHGLGVPAACFVIRQNYDGYLEGAVLDESAPAVQAKLDQNNQLAIQCNVNATMDLWFYPRASQVIPTGETQSP